MHTQKSPLELCTYKSLWWDFCRKKFCTCKKMSSTARWEKSCQQPGETFFFFFAGAKFVQIFHWQPGLQPGETFLAWAKFHWQPDEIYAPVKISPKARCLYGISPQSPWQSNGNNFFMTNSGTKLSPPPPNINEIKPPHESLKIFVHIYLVFFFAFDTIFSFCCA